MIPHSIPLVAVRRHLHWETLWQRYRRLRQLHYQMSRTREQLIEEAFDLGTETYKSALDSGILKPLSSPLKELYDA